MVSIADGEGNILGQGMIAFDAANARKIIGKRSTDIEEILGYAGRSEMIHRDDMIIKDTKPASTPNSADEQDA